MIVAETFTKAKWKIKIYQVLVSISERTYISQLRIKSNKSSNVTSINNTIKYIPSLEILTLKGKIIGIEKI